MFVRTKFDKDRNRTRIQIVQSVREGRKIKQKIVRHVGAARSDSDIEALKQLARTFMEELRQAHSPQQELFTPGQYAELIQATRTTARPTRLGVDLGECQEDARVALGVRDVFGQICTTFGWDQLLGARRRSSNRIVQELVMARIAQPRSKRGTVLDLAQDAGVTLNLARGYETMDLLDEPVIARIQQRSHLQTQALLPKPIDVLFYDCTTLYFES